MTLKDVAGWGYYPHLPTPLNFRTQYDWQGMNMPTIVTLGYSFFPFPAIVVFIGWACSCRSGQAGWRMVLHTEKRINIFLLLPVQQRFHHRQR